MIIKQEFEILTDTLGVANINMKDLLGQSRELADKWQNYGVENENGVNFKIDDTMKFIFNPVTGETRRTDISEFAFSQLCTRLGVPASYVKKCFDSGKIDLALQNFHAWAGDMNKNMLIREHGGVVRAVLSDSYTPFDSHKVIRTLYNTVDDTIYQPNQVLLSQDRLHIRFVNFEPLPFDDDKMYVGFTVDSSDVGRGSLNMKFFIYRSVCKNGMVISKMGGTLFRQNHIGSAMTGGKLELFNRALVDIDTLTANAVQLIKENRNRFLKDYELEMYLEKAKKELRLSEKSQEKLKDLINNTYNHTTWGVINSITELAHDFTLDTRLELEAWAGDMLTKVA